MTKLGSKTAQLLFREIQNVYPAYSNILASRLVKTPPLVNVSFVIMSAADWDPSVMPILKKIGRHLKVRHS